MESSGKEPPTHKGALTRLVKMLQGQVGVMCAFVNVHASRSCCVCQDELIRPRRAQLYCPVSMFT